MRLRIDFSLNNARALVRYRKSLASAFRRKTTFYSSDFFFPRLAVADSESLSKYELSGGGIGIHLESLDEDLYVPNLLLGITDINKLDKPA